MEPHPKEIDHFRPKSRPEFYYLAYAWTNLFLTCTACNSAKREQWDEALLRPDEEDFAFERYFYAEATGELIPRPGASTVDQHRARRTIAILGLNAGDKVLARRSAARAMRRAAPGELDEFPYRFLLPLAREMPS